MAPPMEKDRFAKDAEFLRYFVEKGVDNEERVSRNGILKKTREMGLREPILSKIRCTCTYDQRGYKVHWNNRVEDDGC